MAKAVKIDVPEGMYNEVAKLVQKGLYRSLADFFYVAGQKELEKFRRLTEIWQPSSSSRHSSGREVREEKGGVED